MFLHPAILAAGLAAVSVPIIIHLLLRRRKKPMEWGAMRFVLEAYRKTRRRTTLERWLLLACRCLLIAAIAFGLARPLVAGRSGDSTSGRTLWLVLDDGLIGQTTRDGKTDLARAVERCKGVLSTLSPGDRAGVVLAGSPARAIVSPPSGNLAGVRAALDALAPTDASSDWAGAIGLTSEAIASDRSGRAEATKNDDTVLLAQAARAGSARLDDPLTRFPVGTRVIAAEPDTGAPRNVAITGVRALRPVLLTSAEGSEAAQTVTVSLRRFGDGTDKAEKTRVTVRLADATQIAPSTATVAWTPGQREAAVTLVVDAPRENAKSPATSALVIAAVDGADAVAGDDRWRLPVVSREALRVGLLADAAARGSSFSSGTADRFRPGQWVTLALRPSESAAIDLIDLDPAALDAARLAGLDAIIVLSPEALSAPAGAEAAAPSGWSRLRPFADQGGLLIVTPPFEPAPRQWAPAMAAALGVPFTVGQAPREFPADAPGRIAPVTGNPDPSDPLATLRGELEVLARPISIFKMTPPIESVAAPSNGGDSREEARVLIRAQDGSPLITMLPRRATGQGVPSGAIVYLSTAFDLRWTDLPAKPLMVPLMHELVRQGVGRARPVYASLAGSKATAPSGTVQLKAVGDAARVLTVDQTGRTAEPVRSAGAFTAVDAQAGDRGLVAVNPAPTADTTPFAREQLAAWLAGALPEQGDSAQPSAVEWAAEAVWSGGLAAADVGGGRARVGAGPLVLAAAVALVLIETLLARLASASAVRKGGAA